MPAASCSFGCNGHVAVVNCMEPPHTGTSSRAVNTDTAGLTSDATWYVEASSWCSTLIATSWEPRRPAHTLPKLPAPISTPEAMHSSTVAGTRQATVCHPSSASKERLSAEDTSKAACLRAPASSPILARWCPAPP